MGLLNQVTNKLGGGNPMIGMVLGLFNQFNGVGGLLQKFQQNGLGHIAQSWLGGQKENLPIQPEQLRSTLGNEPIDSISQQSGLPTNQILQLLSQHLPAIVNKLTPGGQIPSGNITEEQLSKIGLSEMPSSFMNKAG